MSAATSTTLWTVANASAPVGADNLSILYDTKVASKLADLNLISTAVERSLIKPVAGFKMFGLSTSYEPSASAVAATVSILKVFTSTFLVS